MAVMMMKIVWLRFQESPTVTTVETTNYPIWNIPFPELRFVTTIKYTFPPPYDLQQTFISYSESIYSKKKKTICSYIPPGLNVSTLHSMFEEKYPDTHVSIHQYRDVFRSRFNLKFGLPRSDTCQNVTDILYNFSMHNC
ncbi:hypothetical protein ANN_14056 [Periplaneta americana]|uniref:Uncharacterized protein n=1 Tax=Periplaneta americana TaxID=6978 RepID=A0ABQ8SVB0_PERAM|nr:hypothetical protein ANN_14056 [Periplaneta americana]